MIAYKMLHIPYMKVHPIREKSFYHSLFFSYFSILSFLLLYTKEKHYILFHLKLYFIILFTIHYQHKFALKITF